MKFEVAVVSFVAGLATAFPVINDPAVVARATALLERQEISDPLGVSQAETNCGPIPCVTWDPSQLISVTGANAYQSPSAGDIRGPCPGLNAAANHGYLPRSGIVDIAGAITGLGALYGMSADLAGFLAAYAIVLDGNVAQGLWSIGGPLPADDLTGALIGTGQGISYSHNNYEGDSSGTREDAYINNGDAHSLIVSRFEQMYATGGSEDRYTMDKFRQVFGKNQDYSVANNPYYFTAVVSTFLVVPGAYNFVINLMSNHTATEPSGYLDGYNLKSFFAVSGDFVWNKGQERIPENWYRRPLDNEYDIPNVFEDLAIGYLSYPSHLRFGGNTGKTNSFVGVDLGDFTGGVFNAANLFQGTNFACFATELIQQAVPDFLNPAVNAIGTSVALIREKLAPYLDSLDCPTIAQYDFTLLNPFPGYKYRPNGPGTNY